MHFVTLIMAMPRHQNVTPDIIIFLSKVVTLSCVQTAYKVHVKKATKSKQKLKRQQVKMYKTAKMNDKI